MLITGTISDVTVAQRGRRAAGEVERSLHAACSTSSASTSTSRSRIPDGRLEELFQGPGADRLLGGAEPDAEMENWDGRVHPDDRAGLRRVQRARSRRARDADVEYRLRRRRRHHALGARPRAPPAGGPTASVEISGIVSDVTERRRMRAELAQAHAALSQVVEAMDAHLYTLRVDPDGAHRDGLPRARTARR